MGSSEEYLDNLLKSIMDGGSAAKEEPMSSMMQDMAGTDDVQEVATSEESDATMNMDDIEAMFASMGAETVEETQEAVPSDGGMLSDELVLDGGMLSDELVLDGGMLSDEPVLDDGMLSDEPVLDDGMLSDELVLDDGMLSDELVLDDGMLSDELVLDDGMLSDEPVLEEGMLPGELPVDEGTLLGELTLDEEMLSDELAPGEEVLTDELSPDDGMLSDELTLDDSLLSDGLAMDDEALSDGLILDDGLLSDDLTLDDSMLSDELLSDVEAMTDDFAIDEDVQNASILDESMEEGAASDDLNLDELGLGDLGLEEMEQNQSEAGDDFALEAGVEAGDDFALEETGEEDADLSALLASMGGDDDLSEINDLLEKSDQGVAVDDDMLAMLNSVSGGEEGDDSFNIFSGEDSPEDIREITPEELAERENSKTKQQKKKEEKERKKREKQARKAKNQKASQDGNSGEDDLSGLMDSMDESGDTPKKKGTFAKFIDFLLEEDEEEDEDNSDDGRVILGNLSEENQELLAELQAEDKKNAKKKDKKGKKGKKGKAGVDDGEEEVEIKPKKPKKEKKKKEKIKEDPQVPEKKLSKKKVASVFLFCATIAACIVVVTILLPEQLEKQEARVAFDQSQYTQVYELLYGKELSEEDEVLLHKSSTILKLQRKLDSYENYKKMDMPLEALNALLEGVSRYQYVRSDAELYNVSSEVAGIYRQILDVLAGNYGLSESDALDIIASGDDVTYSQRIQEVVSGGVFGANEQELPEGKQDVLPEEEEIIDRLEGTETE